MVWLRPECLPFFCPLSLRSFSEHRLTPAAPSDEELGSGVGDVAAAVLCAQIVAAVLRKVSKRHQIPVLWLAHRKGSATVATKASSSWPPALMPLLSALCLQDRVCFVDGEPPPQTADTICVPVHVARTKAPPLLRRASLYACAKCDAPLAPVLHLASAALEICAARPGMLATDALVALSCLVEDREDLAVVLCVAHQMATDDDVSDVLDACIELHVPSQ